MADILKGIVGFIIISFRLLLFIGSLLLALVAISILAVTFYYKHIFSTLIDYGYWPGHYSIWLMVTGVYLFLLSVVACSGLCFNQKSIIKLFSLLAFINVILGLIILVSYLPSDQDIVSILEPRLDKAMTKYDFLYRPPNSEAPATNQEVRSAIGGQPVSVDTPQPAKQLFTNKKEITIRVNQNNNNAVVYPIETARKYPNNVPSRAHYLSTDIDINIPPKADTSYSDDVTKFWDNFQEKFLCCGLQTKDEWLKYSPDGKSYPKSCCANGVLRLKYDRQLYDICKEAEYQSNCLSRIEVPLFALKFLIVMATLACIILSIVGYISSFRVSWKKSQLN